MEQLLRPYGVVIDGTLELGLEILVSDGEIQEVRPHTGLPEPYVVSAAFVNAHSHLEYRGLQDRLKETSYWPWIRAITQAKHEQALGQVRLDCFTAAEENRKTGVAAIAEHSDRPYSGEAIARSGLKGVIFQEVITRFEADGPERRLDRATADCVKQGLQGHCKSFLAPHAYQTVDEETLRLFGASGMPFSMHVAETDLEDELTQDGSGAIGDTFRELGVPYASTGKGLIPTLDDLGLVRDGAQYVHCCAISEPEIALLASRGVRVAHCPRSNRNLSCPIAPVREMLDAGVMVGLGLDSAASSGPIDMFDEMRCAVQAATERGRPVSAEEVWMMATESGAESLRFAVPDLPDWRVRAGSKVGLIKILVPDALTTEDLIVRGCSELVEWVNGLPTTHP